MDRTNLPPIEVEPAPSPAEVVRALVQVSGVFAWVALQAVREELSDLLWRLRPERRTGA